MIENEDDIVISGVSGRYPNADNVEQLWERLLSGVTLATPETVWPTRGKIALPILRGQVLSTEKFDYEFFDCSEYEANLLDPEIRLFMETTFEAIYDAGINPQELRGSKTGVCIGTCYNDTETAIRSKQFDVDPVLQFTASRMSTTFDFRGPIVVADTACASSLSCLNEAYLLMKKGLVENIILGGLAVHLSTFITFAFRSLRMISYDGHSKCLDKNVDGYCRSESVVSLLLQKRRNAKRIYASILHSKTNTDGYKEEGITFPKYETQKSLMEDTLKEAKIDPLSINYIEAHMTGTAAGDVVESKSIVDVYRPNSTKPIKFGCLKSNLGHSEGASGCVALTKVCLVFQNCLIPPNINYRIPNPNIEPLMNGVIEQVLKPTPFNDDIIPVNSFGFGGVNIHAVLKANKKRITKDSFNFAPDFPRLVTFSGRTTDSVKYAFNWIENNKEKITNDFLALISPVSVIEPTSGFNGRGFILFDKKLTHTTEITEISEKSPVSLVFPGLDLTNNQYFNELMKIKPFAKSIDECDEILRLLSFDLKSLLKQSKYKNIVEAFICTVSLQIAAFETLDYIGFQAEAFIGESIGEICAAFADKCLTKYDALWITFYIASSINEQKNNGIMISLNIFTDQLTTRRFPNVEFVGMDLNGHSIITCSHDNFPHLSQLLNKEKLSFNVLETYGKVFHNSNFGFVELLAKKIQNLLNSNNSSNSKWIQRGNDNLWDYFSKLLFTNLKTNSTPKLMSSVEMKNFTFADKNSNELITTTNLNGSTQQLLNVIGKVYNFGHNVAIEKLYPSVKFPVPRETASLSHLVTWNHSKNLVVHRHPDYFAIDRKSQRKVTVDLADPSFKFVDGHYIDGKLLYPATGYLYLVAQSCLGYGDEVTEQSFEFRNVKFRRATLIPKVGSVVLVCNFNSGTGEFEIFEGGSICVSGFVRIKGEEEIENNEFDLYEEEDTSKDIITLKGKEIYKELRIRGYDYGPNYQCLEEVQSDGRKGKIKWNGSWVNFADSVLQLSLFEQKQKTLFIPTSIEYMLFDNRKFEAFLDNDTLNTSTIFEATNYNRNVVVGNGAMVIKNILGAATSRRLPETEVVTIAETFVPYNEFINAESKTEWSGYCDTCVKIIDKLSNNDYEFENINAIREKITENEKHTFLALLVEAIEERKNISELIEKHKNSLDNDFSVNCVDESLIGQQIDVVVENCDRDIQVLEVNSTQNILLPAVIDRIHENLMTCSTALIHPTATSVSAPFVQQLDKWDSQKDLIPSTHKDIDLIVYKDWSTSFAKDENFNEFNVDLKTFLTSVQESLKDNGFLLAIFREKMSPIEEKFMQLQRFVVPKVRSLVEIRKSIQESDMSLISEKIDNLSNISFLLRKTTKNKESEEPIVIATKTKTYEWIEEVKEAIKQKERKVWLLANDCEVSGLIGFVKCLRKEAKGATVRCLFGVNAELTKQMIQNDLVMNVVRNSELGSFRHKKADLSKMKKVCNRFVLDIETKGDLSSLKWFQNDDKDVDERINIYYASLNFKDVMVAAGKVPLNVYPSDWKNLVPIGMEFSGIDENNNRICGFGDGGAIASVYSRFAWKIQIPDDWTLEEGATIPVVYATVYYSLIIRGKLLSGESILIHAGTGGVGQAAISVCLRMKCNVFVTVGSEEKKQFLLNNFPDLKPEQIGNSRSISFEELVLKKTDGKGVDVILNSLAEEKQRASIRCLAKYGRFLEIGKYDLVIDSPLDPLEFEANQTFHVICVAHLTAGMLTRDIGAKKMMTEMLNLLKRGLKEGEVRPLKRTVFEKNQSEEAFRFMASGKHIGKVLIKIRDENQPLKANFSMEVVPKTFFSSEKSYVISGGLGGFGLEVAYWMVHRGANKIILSSRNGFKDNYQRYAVKRMEENGAKVKIIVNDCTTLDKTKDLLLSAIKMGPVGGIFNLNLVLRDAPLDEQTIDAFNEVCASKVYTTLNFDELCRKMCPKLDYFVCFSSVAALLGNTSQTNYGFANSVMERICEQRRKEGLHGLAIQWGSVGDVGFVAENIANSEMLLRGSVVSQRMPSCLQTLDRLLNCSHPVITSALRNLRRSGVGSKDDILKQICHVLGVKDPEKLDPNTTLSDLGMDSLMAVEIKQGLEREYDTILSTQEIRGLTVKELKEIEKRKTTVNGEGKIGTDKLSFNKSYLEMATEIFTPLNDFEKGMPIFFFPPVEGNFNLLLGIVQFLDRPAIAVNWTAEINTLKTVKEVGARYAELIKEQYKLVEYDFVGYSFGAVIALETSIQLQASVSNAAVKKLILLDGSPDFLRFQVTDAFKDKSNKSVTEQFMDFITTKIKLENLEIMKLKEELLRLNTKEKKALKLSELISAKLSEKCEPTLLLASIDRMSKKVEMVSEMVMHRKFYGILSLIRAKDITRTLPFHTISNDYGLSEWVDGKVNVIVKPGHHESFITMNTEEISRFIEDEFCVEFL